MRNYSISEFKSRISVPLSEVNLDKVLATGQVFRWRKQCNTWFGVIRQRLWILRQDETAIHYQYHDIVPPPSSSTSDPKIQLTDFLNLGHKLSDITLPWLSLDPHLSGLITCHGGLRLLRQEPHECLLSFITSSCNNIPRISSLLLKLSSLSPHCITLHGTSFHTLPTMSYLAEQISEHALRDLGFGYRAKYLVSAARDVVERGGEAWLESLREVELEKARRELSRLAGVGPKVASCVCLMSLDKHSAVPIDTHMFQVAVKYYNRPNKPLTPALHNTIEEFFQNLHGDYAGWAQAYLFYSNSKKEKPGVSSAKRGIESGIILSDKETKKKKNKKKDIIKSLSSSETPDEYLSENSNNHRAPPRTRSQILKVS